MGFVLRLPGHREVISNIESVTLSAVSVMLTSATISPEGGERTDSLSKKPESFRRKMTQKR